MHSRQLFGYRELNPNRLTMYLEAMPELVAVLGGRPAAWQVEQVQDNDMNLVFMVDGPNGQLCVKQAMPHVTLGGQAIDVPLERTIYEEAALALFGRIVPHLVPRVLHYDSAQFLLVMQRLGGHRPLRTCLVDGQMVERLPETIGAGLAASLFATSDFGMPAVEKRERIAFFCGNSELRKVSEQLLFTEPFAPFGTSAWLTPELDLEVRGLRQDADLKRAVAGLHLKILCEPQALIHGDLHSGSIMADGADLKVIDAEFATFGPIGFDLGTLLGSLLIAYFSQPGHASADRPRDVMEDWLLTAIKDLWASFHRNFIGRWREGSEGDGTPKVLFEGPGSREARLQFEQDYLRRVFIDALRFAGLEMVRRVLGCRPVADLGSIADREQRARAERKTLLLGCELIKDGHHVADLGEVAHVARQIQSGAINRA